MKKTLLFLSLTVAFSAGLGRAATCASITPVNYSTLMGQGATGCTINDLLFNNFSFAGSATGVGVLPVSTQVSYLLDNPSTSTQTGQQIWGFEFNPNLALNGIGSQDILIAYDITAPFAEITSIHLLETAAVTTGTSATVAETDCGKVTLAGGCVFLPTVTVTPTNPHQDILSIGPFISVHVIKDINIQSSVVGGIVSLSNVRDAVDTPEPASYLLFGGGLIGLAMARYRRR